MNQVEWFRYATLALLGRWRTKREDAVRDALRAGQAYRRGGKIRLHEFTTIESSSEERDEMPDGELASEAG